jgi:hypothetical protein
MAEKKAAKLVFSFILVFFSILSQADWFDVFENL